MADTDATPMTDGDITPNAGPEPAAPPAGSRGGPSGDEGGTLGGATQTLKDGASKYGTQAADKARAFADTGKERASGALTQFSQLLNEAAGQVDEKLGNHYGDYARSAAGQVSTFADTLQAKNVDELLDDARGYVRKSPGVAVGVAAALGFVVARLIQSGIDGNKA